MKKSYQFKCIIVGLLVMHGYWLSQMAFSQSAKPHPVQPSNQDYSQTTILVRFSAKSRGLQRNRNEKSQFMHSVLGARVKKNYRRVPGLSLVELPKGLSVENSLKMLEKKAEILYAEPNYKIYPLSTVPDDPNFPDQWHLDNSNAYNADINAPEAWDIATNSNIIVAVLDSGIHYGHPDLNDSMWVNSSEQIGDGNSDGKPGIANVDDDGDGLVDEDSNDLEPGDPNYTNDLVNDDDENGYADDIRGWDFADQHDNVISDNYFYRSTTIRITG